MKIKNFYSTKSFILFFFFFFFLCFVLFFALKNYIPIILGILKSK